MLTRGSAGFLSEDPSIAWRHTSDKYLYVGNGPVSYVDPMGLWKTTGRTTVPANSPPNTIECDGAGGIRPRVVVKDGTPACIIDCLTRHEQRHADDARAASPNVCRGKPAGVIVEYSTYTEGAASEKSACRIQLDCLKDYEKQDPGCRASDCTDLALAFNIMLVEAYCGPNQ